MRIWNSLLIAIFTLLVLASCKTNTTSPNNNGTSDNGPYDTKGSDYAVLAANTQVSAHFRGAERDYDLNGSLTGLDSIDQDHIAVVMSNAVMLGLPGYSIGAYDDHGNLTNYGDPIGYTAEANGIIYASDKDLTEKAIVLPNDLSAGSWNPDPNGSPDFIANLTGHMASFTTYNGNTYSNVIEVTASNHDSSSYSEYNGGWNIQVQNETVNFYFAKGVGPIQIDLANAEMHDYRINSGRISNYEKSVYSGSIARNGP